MKRLNTGEIGIMRFLLIITVLLVAVLAALFIVPLGGGKPLLDWQHVERNWQQPAKLFDSNVSPWLEKKGQTGLYRWRDPDGNWQYGQIPPPGVSVEPITVKAPDTISAEEMRGDKGLETQQKQ
ncbi:MAG: DUF4124 domain-containing protein [Alcanivorax sp.]